MELRKTVKRPKRYDPDASDTPDAEQHIPSASRPAFQQMVVQYNPLLPCAAFPTLDGSVNALSESYQPTGPHQPHFQSPKSSDFEDHQTRSKTSMPSISKKHALAKVAVRRQPRSPSSEPEDCPEANNGPENSTYVSNVKLIKKLSRRTDEEWTMQEMETSDEGEQPLKAQIASRNMEQAKTINHEGWDGLAPIHQMNIVDALAKQSTSRGDAMDCLRLNPTQRRRLDEHLTLRRQQEAAEDENIMSFQAKVTRALVQEDNDPSKKLTQTAYRRLLDRYSRGFIDADKEDYTTSTKTELYKAQKFLGSKLATSLIGMWSTVDEVGCFANGTNPSVAESQPVTRTDQRMEETAVASNKKLSQNRPAKIAKATINDAPVVKKTLTLKDKPKTTATKERLAKTDPSRSTSAPMNSIIKSVSVPSQELLDSHFTTGQVLPDIEIPSSSVHTQDVGFTQPAKGLQTKYTGDGQHTWEPQSDLSIKYRGGSISGNSRESSQYRRDTLNCERLQQNSGIVNIKASRCQNSPDADAVTNSIQCTIGDPPEPVSTRKELLHQSRERGNGTMFSISQTSHEGGRHSGIAPPSGNSNVSQTLPCQKITNALGVSEGNGLTDVNRREPGSDSVYRSMMSIWTNPPASITTGDSQDAKEVVQSGLTPDPKLDTSGSQTQEPLKKKRAYRKKPDNPVRTENDQENVVKVGSTMLDPAAEPRSIDEGTKAQEPPRKRQMTRRLIELQHPKEPSIPHRSLLKRRKDDAINTNSDEATQGAENSGPKNLAKVKPSDGGNETGEPPKKKRITRSNADVLTLKDPVAPPKSSYQGTARAKDSSSTRMVKGGRKGL